MKHASCGSLELLLQESFERAFKGAVAVAQKMPRTAPRENGRFPRYFTRRRYDGISPWSP